MDMVRLFVLLTLLALAAGARLPVPFCNSHSIFKQGPLSFSEKVVINTGDAFSGYNLDIALVSNNSFAKINKKFQEIDRMGTYFPGLITHHIEQDANGWGKESFLIYKDSNGITRFVYGLMKDNYHVPQFDFTLQITNSSSENCLGAALFLDYGMAVIDCIKSTGDKSNPLQNYFIYVDLATHNIIKTVNNPMFVKFT